MCGVTKLHNERIRGTTKVGEIAKNVQERKLKLYGCACDEKIGTLRRKEGHGYESRKKKEDRKAKKKMVGQSLG